MDTPEEPVPEASDSPAINDTAGGAAPQRYQVLARKYRPARFADLIGQDALVRTLTNAIRHDRIAHAFILTGVRGVGKTTTARIIARALNCTGHGDRPTPEPCGTCDACVSIGQDRHVDVLEMDAASRTGVDDIREVIDGVRYGPVAARYKVYIIDEIHMLSKQAFNALLKTLEEPPEHVKFIFATTEIRRVPATILSRCQRFDLPRVDTDTLSKHFSMVTNSEGARIEDEALAMIARAADGSVRDGLSILDQAIGMADATVTADQVRAMLGLADQTQAVSLFEAVVAGRIAEALDQFADMVRNGADPVMVIQDLLSFTHTVTRARVVGAETAAAALGETARDTAASLAQSLSIASLTRLWQMTLKGLGEVQQAPIPADAAEMVLIRLAHVADMPTPGDLVRQLSDPGNGTAQPSTQAASGTATASGPHGAPRSTGTPAASRPADGPGTGTSGPNGTPGGGQIYASAGGDGRARAYHQADPEMQRLNDPAPVGPQADQDADIPPPASAEPDFSIVPRSPDRDAHAEVDADTPDAGQMEPAVVSDPLTFPDLVALFGEQREMILQGHLYSNVHLVRFEPGRLEFRPERKAPSDLANRVGKLLGEWTGRRWMVSISRETGDPPLAEQDRAEQNRILGEAEAHPMVQAARAAFPNARITEVRDLMAMDGAAPTGPGDDGAPQGDDTLTYDDAIVAPDDDDFDDDVGGDDDGER